MALKDSFVSEVLPYVITVFLGLTVLISFIVNMKIRNIMNNKLKFTTFARMLTIQFIVLDCFAALFVFIPSAIVSSALSWILTDYVCKAHGIVITWIYLVTFGLLSVRNIERMYKLRFPNSYESKFGSKGKLTIVFILIWIIDLGVACIPLTEWTPIKYDYHHSSCVPDLETNIYHLMLIIGLGIGVTSIIFLFTNIIIYNTKDKDKETSDNTNANVDETNRKDPAYVSKRQDSNVSVNNWVGSTNVKKNEKSQKEVLSRPPSFNSWLKKESNTKEDEKKKTISWSEFRHATTTNFALCIIMLLFFVPYFALVIARAICGSCIHKSEVSATLVFVVLTFTIRPILTHQRLCRVIKSKEERKLNRRKRKRFTNINNNPEAPEEKSNDRKDSLFDEGFDETEFGEFDDDLEVPKDTEDQTMVKTNAGLATHDSAKKTKYNKDKDNTESKPDEDSPWESECDIFLSDDDTDDDESGNKIKKTLLLGGAAASMTKEDEKTKKKDKLKKESSKTGKKDEKPNKNSKKTPESGQGQRERDVIENEVVTVVVINKHTSNKTEIENTMKNSSQGNRESNDEKGGDNIHKNSKQTKSNSSKSKSDCSSESGNSHSHTVVKGVALNKAVKAGKSSTNSNRHHSNLTEENYEYDERAVNSKESKTKMKDQGNIRETTEDSLNHTSVLMINRHQHNVNEASQHKRGTTSDTRNPAKNVQKSNVTMNEIHTTTNVNETEYSPYVHEDKITKRKIVVPTTYRKQTNDNIHRQSNDNIEGQLSDKIYGQTYDNNYRQTNNNYRQTNDNIHRQTNDNIHRQTNDNIHRQISDNTHRQTNDNIQIQTNDNTHRQTNDNTHRQTNDDIHRQTNDNIHKQTNDNINRHTTFTMDTNEVLIVKQTSDHVRYRHHDSESKEYQNERKHVKSKHESGGNYKKYPNDAKSRPNGRYEADSISKAVVIGNKASFSQNQHHSQKRSNEKYAHHDKSTENYGDEYIISHNQNSNLNKITEENVQSSRTGQKHGKNVVHKNAYRNGIPNSTSNSKGTYIASNTYGNDGNDAWSNIEDHASNTKRNRHLLNVNHMHNYNSSSMPIGNEYHNSKDTLPNDVQNSNDRRYSNDETLAYKPNNSYNTQHANHNYKGLQNNDSLQEIKHVNESHDELQMAPKRKYSYNQPSDKLMDRTLIHSKSDDNIIINQSDGLPKYDSSKKKNEVTKKSKPNETKVAFASNVKDNNAAQEGKRPEQNTGLDASKLATSNIEEKTRKGNRSNKPKEVIRFDPYSVTEPLKTVKLWNKANANVNAINVLAKLNKFQALHGENPQ